MRRREPHIFTLEALRLEGARIRELSVHCFERALAQKAFARAAGIPEPYASTRRGELIACLQGAYVELGLSESREASRRLLHDIERAAVAQARATSDYRAPAPDDG